MIIHTMQQGSDEWHRVRLGKFTATDMATVANGRADTQKKLIYKKAAEIITGSWDGGYSNHHMERGLALEDDARQLFSFTYGLEVVEVGFVEYNEFAGCSPDGLIEPDAGWENKCKDLHTHAQTLVEGDNSYKWQLYSSMFFTGREKWYFSSYNPFFPVGKELYVKLWEPDEKHFKMIEDGLEKCTNMLVDVLHKLGVK